MKLIIGVTGASGAIYAKLLFQKIKSLSSQIEECCVIFSENAKTVWRYELGNEDYEDIPFKIYEPNDFFAPFASGSANFDTMIICPCTMGTLGRIVSGISNDLMTRSADVILKERRKLILLTREMPLNFIHLENMKNITLAGGIICPASPTFYSKPKNISELCETVIDRLISLTGLKTDSFSWGGEK
ncbi:MAG: UbiX family flavin prenyltransferase [Bacteroidales bacterium]|nr:UbiX family flavin prenyltransferase [Bacteroidales bacterium]